MKKKIRSICGGRVSTILVPLVFCLVGALMLVSLPANATELITNGGFETGSFTGWSQYASTHFFVSNSNISPLDLQPTAGPASDTYYAVTGSDGGYRAGLWQNFSLASAASVHVTFDMFVNNYMATAIEGGLADFSISSVNQYARVDLMVGNPVVEYSTSAADILANYYLGADSPSGTSHPYVHYDFTESLAAGDYRLRFAMIATTTSFNLGVDNVSVQTVSSTSVPEPTTLLLLGLGLFGVAGFRKRIGM